MAIGLFKGKIRFDRNEFAGSFGDIGTDFPLIVSLIAVCGLDPASVLVMFGAMQVLTGLTYGIPMPVQPLKAMSVIMITQKLGGDILHAAGLVIGIIMLILSCTGLLNWIARIIPKCVVRGIQFGLGCQLALLAVKDYVPADGAWGYVLAAIAFFVILLFWGNRRYPAALFVIALGIVYAIFLQLNLKILWEGVGFHAPRWHVPDTSDMLQGFFLLALPQLSLSLGNSILATKQIAQDYFPEKNLTVNKIGRTYAFMNLVAPFFSGIPVCHGSGGMAGHYSFGARTGGSVMIYGTLYLILGFFLSGVFGQIVNIFPKPILGIILFIEGTALVRLIKDVSAVPAEWIIAVMVGLMAIGLPYGYFVAMIVGTLVYYFVQNRLIRIYSASL